MVRSSRWQLCMSIYMCVCACVRACDCEALVTDAKHPFIFCRWTEQSTEYVLVSVILLSPVSLLRLFLTPAKSTNEPVGCFDSMLCTRVYRTKSSTTIFVTLSQVLLGCNHAIITHSKSHHTPSGNIVFQRGTQYSVDSIQLYFGHGLPRGHCG